jgi:hypothetical protein
MNPMKMMALVGDVAAGGMSALAPMLAETAPGAVRAAYVQRIAALVAERAALLSRLCGDAMAAGLRDKGDVAPLHLAELQALAEKVQALANMLPPATATVTTDGLAVAYSQGVAAIGAPPVPAVQPAPREASQAARIMASGDGL